VFGDNFRQTGINGNITNGSLQYTTAAILNTGNDITAAESV
jgi:hypothetical protein